MVDGPYLNAPKKLRDLLDEIKEGDTLKMTKFDFSKLGFPEKKTENNFCSRFMQNNEPCKL